MSGRTARAAELAGWVESLALAPAARVLLVGEGAPEDAAALAARGIAATAAGPSARAEGTFAAALVDGALETCAWDRWLLQRVRARLEPGAPVRVRARNVASLASPADALALGARVAGRAAGRLGGGHAGGAARRGGRRYSRSRLVSLLERAGFAVERVAGSAFGAAWTAHARARAADPLTGLVAEAPERELVPGWDRAFDAARAGWLAGHRPAGPPAAPRRFDASAYAHGAVLALAPHPDDEVVGAGGTLLRLVHAGARVVCLVATDGSAGEALRGAPEAVRRAARVAEAHAVAARAGFAELVPWSLDEATFRATPELAARLAELLARERPALVFTPWLTDHHPHHAAMSVLLAAALERLPAALEPSALVLGYEVWSAAPADLVSEVTDLRAEVEALLWTYDTGMKVDDFVALWTRRGLRHARALLGRPGLAEVFFACPARDYPALVRATGPGPQAWPTASV